MIKKFYLLAILLAGFTFYGLSQNISNYNFSAYSGSFTNITGGITPTWSSGNSDEGYVNSIPIGFNFWYMGVRYSTVSASSNGWISFGANITSAAPGNNLTSGGSPRPILAPLWDDLNVQSTSNITYVTTGTAGSKIFTLQYLNVKWSKTATGSTMSFQVKLYEGTGKIEFTYRQEASSLTSPTASIGISAVATGSGNFLSVNNNGTSASSTTEASITSKPLTGNNYSFTPKVLPAPGSLTFSEINSSSMTLNWADLSTNETGFLIYRSTDGLNYTFVSQTAANATSSEQTGLTPSTSYYWKVYAVSEGALSTTSLSGTQATGCLQPTPPAVTTPVNYCQNATAIQLTATGTNLLWGGTAGASGSVGGTVPLTTANWVETVWNNKKTNFSTTTENVTITTVDYYIPAYQAVNGLVLSIYNSSGTVIATSTTNTTLNSGAAVSKITNTFDFTLSEAGAYSIGVSAGTGNIGSDNPTFPISEVTGTINITGASTSGIRCFNNIQFTTATGSIAPVPSTTLVGSTDYQVTQTIAGCVSKKATITVNVTGVDISQIPSADVIANYKLKGNANDATSNNPGTLQGSPAQTADRFGVIGSAYNFNGSSQYISTNNSYNNPNTFTVSIWFKTSTTTGGKLIGFGSSQTGTSGQYDRHIYMNNAGQIYFGVYPSVVVTVNSALSYNDNQWHLATATLSGAGMILYIDGAQVGSNPTTTSAENYTGYWRIGFDNCTGWTSTPSSYYFNGQLDEALIYSRALSAAEIATLYNSPDGAGNNGPVCSGSILTLSSTPVSGASYNWSGPNSFSSSSQNPSIPYTAANAGTYTLKVTSGSCFATAYTNVVSSTNAGQWTGNVSTDWANANNWCSGEVPVSTTNVTISSGAVRMPVITSNAYCKNLTVNSGATVTTNAGGTLNVAGNIANSGTMTNSGTTNFNGTGAQQTFSGITTFNNLTLNNTNGLLLPAVTTLSGNLTLTSGILTANNFVISLAGNWINNASINAFAGGTSGVIFSGTSNQSISGSAVTMFNNVSVNNNGFMVSLGVNANIAGNLTVTKGTFDLGTFTANRVIAGGILTIDNNATLKIGGTNTYPTNYSTNNLAVSSTVEYSGTNQTVSNQSYGNLKFSSSSGAAVKTLPAAALSVLGNLISIKGAGTSVTYTALAAITVNGNDSIGTATTFNGGSFNHNIGGNWANTGTFNGNTGKITFTGNGKLVSGTGAQNFNDLTVAASGVSFSNGSLILSGNLATTGSGTFSQVSGGTLTMTGSSKTISGSGISLDNLTISGSVSTAISLELTGNLNVTGSFTSTAGTLSMSGTGKTITGSGSKNFQVLSVTGSITASANFNIASGLVVSGSLNGTSGTATFTGSSVLSGTANLYNVTVNGTFLQLSANSNLGVANSLTITTGTLNTTSSVPNTVNFNGSGAQNINAITYDNLDLTNTGNKTALGAITVNKNITIGSGATFVGGAYTHSVYLNWINNGNFTAGTGTVRFHGNQTSNITGATTFNILTIASTSSSAGVVLQSDISAAFVNMTQGNMLTGSNTITISITRTGNGIILGNIKRSHAFTTGIAYAFEGPENTITFSSVSSVTSVTVSVDLGSVSDFPFGGSIAREYNITVPAGTYNATLRLHYEDNELNGTDESTMSLWNYSGSAWIAQGKTGNNTTSNYVEKSGLTNITNRWTCSDNSNVVQWNGSLSSDWNTADNWTVTQGSASRPPASTDIVNLGTAAFINQPTISSAVTVKNINFGSVQAVTLSMAGGGSLVTGDIKGTWSSNVAHTINANNQAITTHGDFLLSDGANGHHINLNIGTGTVNVGGNLNQSGNASIVFSGAGNLNIGADYNYVDGTFTAGTGTVTYNGLVNQVAGSVNYHNLKVDKTAALASINSTLAINGNLEVIAGELDNFAATTIVGNVTIHAGATLLNNNILHVGGNWINNGAYISSGSNSNVIFNGSGPQNISASTFNNLEFNKALGSVATLTGDVTISGNLVGTSGTLDIKNFFFNRDVAGGSATMADAATLIIAGDNAPNKFANYFLSTGSTVIFNGTTDQHLLLPGVVYGNILFRNSGTKTLYTPITVKNDLTIESGATFNGGSNVITLNGNWINEGTFNPATSTLLANGISKTISGNTTFNKLTASGSYTFLNDMTFNGLLNITSTGSLSGGASINTTMNADLINSGILYTLGTTTFTGNVVQTLSLIDAVTTVALTVNFNGTVSPVLNSTSSPQFGYLNINNTGGVNPSVGWTVLYGFTVGAGAAFNGGVFSHNFLGDVTNNGTITGSGRFNFLPSSPVTINLGIGFKNTGNVYFDGAGALTLLGTPISFNNLTINNTNTSGLTPSSNWNITNNFQVATGSILHAANFNYHVGGNILNNGTIDSQGSTFTLNGTGTQNINTLSALNNVTVNKASGYCTLSKDLTIGGELNFTKGIIEAEAFTVIQPTGGTVTGAAQNTGWVAGKFQKAVAAATITKAFEIGDNSNYTPVSLLFSSVSTGGNLTALSIAGEHPHISNSQINPTKSLNRYWTLSNDGVVFTEATGTFNFVEGDVDAGTNTANFKAARYNGSSWIWPTTLNPEATHIQAANLSTFGDFAFGEICNSGTTINYAASPYCSNAGNASITLAGSTGGQFSAEPGLSINAATGSVDLLASTPDSYVVAYTVAPTVGCPSFVTTANIIVTSAPSAIISYDNNPYCSSAGMAAITVIGTTGGIFTSAAALDLDPVTGYVDLEASSAGTYTVDYTIAAAGGCSAFTTTTDITVTTQPLAIGQYDGNPYCTTGGLAIPTVTFAGIPGTISSTSGLSIDPSTGVINLAASTPGIYTATYTAPASGGCALYTNTATVSIVLAGTWTGAVSSDWNEARNWLCGEIPSSATNVILNNHLPVYPVVTTSGAANKITIKTGAALTVNIGTLQIADSIFNSGTFDAGEGTIEMNGTAAQTISANTFQDNALNHLVINNSHASGVSLDADLDVYGSVTFLGSGRVFHTNDYLTLKSNEFKTARVGNMTGNSLTGKVTVERYLSANKSWRLLSIPTNTTQTIKQAWQENASSTNEDPIAHYGTQLISDHKTWLTEGFDLYSATGPSMKMFNVLENKWVGVSSTNATNIKTSSGYMIFVRGDRLSNAFNSPVTETTLRTKGELYSGTQPAFSLEPDKLTSVGNPYASPIDFSKITKGNGVDDIYYAWDPFIAGSYNVGGYQTMSAVDGYKPHPGGSSAYPAGTPVPIIQSGQAVFMHATTVDPVLPDSYKISFIENAKSNIGESGDPDGPIARKLGRGELPTKRQLFEVTLYTGPNATDKVADGNVVAFDPAYSDEIDGKDAFKITAGGENFDIKRNGKLLVVEARSELTLTDTIYYNMTNMAQRNYQLRFAPENMQTTGLQAFLLDKFLSQETPISLYDSSFINITVSSNVLSKAADRFSVVFRPMSALPVTITSLKATEKEGEILVEWKVENELNISQYEVEKSLDGIHFSKTTIVPVNNNGNQIYKWLDKNAAPGYHYYRIKAVEVNGQNSLTQIVKVLVGSSLAEISVYPNPIVNEVINIQLTAQPKGQYQIRLLNSLGQVMISKNIFHHGGSGNETLKWDRNFAKGIYQLEITQPGGGLKVIKVVN